MLRLNLSIVAFVAKNQAKKLNINKCGQTFGRLIDENAQYDFAKRILAGYYTWIPFIILHESCMFGTTSCPSTTKTQAFC